MLFINNYTKKVLSKDPFYYVVKQPRAFSLLMLSVYPNATYPYFNDPTNPFIPYGNLAFASWFLDNKTTDLTKITNPVTIQNLLYSINTDSALRPIFRNSLRIALYEGRSAYMSIYHIFDEDEFYYLYPCPQPTDTIKIKSFPMNANCLLSKQSNFSITCYQFYLESKYYAEHLNAYLNIKTPYVYGDQKNLSANIYDAGVDLAISVCASIMKNASQLNMMTCIEANVTDLKTYLFSSNAAKLGSLTILGFKPDQLIGDVVLRKDLNLTFFQNSSMNSFIEMEFEVILMIDNRYMIDNLFFNRYLKT